MTPFQIFELKSQMIILNPKSDVKNPPCNPYGRQDIFIPIYEN
jgi:hypothetical protein